MGLIEWYYGHDTNDRSTIDKLYLDYVRNSRCSVCGRKPVHAHHVRILPYCGIGKKPPDIFCIPLCVDHHTGNFGIHRMGIYTFEKKFGVILKDVLNDVHRRFSVYISKI